MGRKHSPVLPRRVALTLLAAAGCTVAWGGAVRADIGFEAFRDEVFAVGRRRFPDLPLAKGADDEEVRSGPLRFYLRNLYATARGMTPAAREAEIVKWFGQMRAGPKAKDDALEAAANDWATAKPLLRPKLMPIDYVTQARTLVHKPFSPHLVIGYGIDLGVKDAYVLDAKLTKWGVPIATVHDTAVANLEAMSTGIALVPREGQGGAGRFLAVNKGDAYDASRLLLPTFRKRLLAALGPAAFAGIPNRDFLIAWSKGFAAQGGFIAKIRADSQSQPYPLTDEIFALGADGVHVATKAELG